MVVARRQGQALTGADESRLQAKVVAIQRRLQDREVECQMLSALLSGSLDANSDPTAILDSKGAILATNLAWQHYQQQIAPNAIASTASYLESCEVPAVKALLRRVAQGQTRDACVGHSVRTRGATRWYETHVSRIDNANQWLVVIHHDVTESEAARQTVNKLTEQLVSMQEEERQRIARELHDSTSQHLAVVGLQLGRLRRAAQADPDSTHIIGEIGASLRQAQAELRAFTYLLHPPELDRNGLKSTVETFVMGFAERTGLKCRCRVDRVVERAPFETQRSIFRVLQEALTNVYRHANARRIFVSVQIADATLRLIVKDDGQGLPQRGHAPGADKVFGVGIPGMQARMQRLGGTAVVRAAKRGTMVVATVPMRRSSDPQSCAPQPRIDARSRGARPSAHPAA